MRKKFFYASILTLTVFLFSGCGKESTAKVITSSLAKLSSIDTIDQDVNSTLKTTSSKIPYSLNISFNEKGNLKDKRYYLNGIVDAGIIKLNTEVNIEDSRPLLRFKNISNKYIDISSGNISQDMTEDLPSKASLSIISDYASLLKKALTIAKNNDYKLNDVNKKINGQDEQVKELIVKVNDDDINSTFKDILLQSPLSSSMDEKQINDITSSISISDFILSTYINKDHMPIYTEITYTISLKDKIYAGKTDFTVLNYNEDIEIPSISTDDIISQDEFKKSVLSSIFKNRTPDN